MYFLGVPELRLTDKEKFENDGRWFEKVMQYHLPASNYDTFLTAASEKLLKNYRYMNNQFDFSEWETVCNELGISEEDFNANTFNVNIIPVIVNYLKTVELRRNDTYTPLLMTQQSLALKDEELKNKVSEAVSGQLLGVIEANKRYQELMAQQPAEEDMQKVQEEVQAIQQEYEKMYPMPQIEGYLSELEILGSKIIQYATLNNKIKYKKVKNETFEDIIINDGEVVRLVPTYDGIDIQRINLPYFLYHKSSETEYVQDGVWAGYTQMYNQAMLKTEFPELTDDDWAKLGMNYYDIKQVTPRIETTHHTKYPEWETQYLQTAMLPFYAPDRGYGTGRIPSLNAERLIPVTHFEFIAFKPIYIVTSYDNLGNEIVDVVDEDFQKPKGEKYKEMNKWGFQTDVTYFEGGKFEELWIPRRYEVTRIGINFYTRKRECLYQTVNLDNPFETKLSYYGKYYSEYNANPIAILDRLKPYNILYMVIFNKFIKLAERWDGYLIPLDLDAIPIELGKGDPDEAFKKFLQLRKDGYLVQTSFVEDGKLTRPAPTILSADVSNTFQILITMLNWIKQEMGMIIGVSPQALSQMVNSNVSDNQQALMQTSYMIDPIFQQHNWTWQEIMTGYVNQFVEWAKEKLENGGEHRLNYIFGENTREVLRMKSDHLDLANYGVVISNSNPKEYYDLMMQHAQAMVQNQLLSEVELSSLLLSMQSGESPYETHKKFMKAKADREARQKAMQEMEQQKIQAQKEGADAMIKAQKYMIDIKEQWEEQHIKTKGEFDLRKEAMKVYQFQETMDANNNNVPDPIEASKLQHKIMESNQKLEIEKEKAITERRSQLFEEQKHADNLIENEKDGKVALQKQGNKPKN